jgi:group I intron endonuclease
MNIYTIYKSTCKITGKSYVGFDSNWPNRQKVHKSASKKQNYKFYRAIRKYGWDNFEWSILYQSTDKQHTLKEMENHFICEYDTFDNGYNSTLGGDGCFGLIVSPEARKKISESNKIPKPQTKKHINLRIKNTTFTRKKKDNYGITEETKLKISKANKGILKPMTEEHIKNLKCHTNNSTKVSCPYCNKIGQLTNMKRWHFDKCKLIPQGLQVFSK